MLNATPHLRRINMAAIIKGGDYDALTLEATYAKDLASLACQHIETPDDKRIGTLLRMLRDRVDNIDAILHRQ